MNANEIATGNGNKRLHPAMFIVPIVIAAVAAIPSVLVLLMIHAFTGLLSGVLHHQISVFDNYFYILILSPTIFLSVAGFVVTHSPESTVRSRAKVFVRRFRRFSPIQKWGMKELREADWKVRRSDFGTTKAQCNNGFVRRFRRFSQIKQ